MEYPIAFINSQGNGQVVTEDRCPTCGYPERHRIYAGDSMDLIADGCPSCETSRMQCPTEYQSTRGAFPHYRCALAAGHEGHHHSDEHGGFEWPRLHGYVRGSGEQEST